MNIFKRLFVVLMLMLPVAAFAATISPLGGANAWSLHVMGNGSTIASVIESIKMVINPAWGGGSFKLLMLFMAVTGFCILAIQAGFNPSQNLFKMFGYVLVVWVVTLSCTTLTANVLVQDKVTMHDYPVSDVPAIVALPASLVSEVGNWLTQTIQQAYSTPDDFSFTKGGFNLFNKMKQDMDSYTITNQNVKRSMSAYIADCTVPALAKGEMSGNQMLRSSNLMETLRDAASPVALTRYYPINGIGSNAGGTGARPGGGIADSRVMTCQSAYANLTTDLEEHATQLLDAASKQWASTGVLVPYEQVMQSWMEAAHLGSGPGGGAYSRPTGMMLQKSLINTMNGDFRQAAVQSGNNEILMGQAISQAEQSQKSGWVTSAMVFQNMMGYVYTTLQAFIFAIVPIMVVALMIPGLGKKIFVNYGQILIWLTLWEPMLSIVNYLVTLFGIQDMQTIMATGNAGFNMANSFIITEQGNNLTIAASFLATMVPLLCWGLVNGAMAFTEFISHGIGSSFSMQAGAQAATGNVSLNSMGMNSLNANKFDNAHKATVGNQSVMAFGTAGSFTQNNDRGGVVTSQNGQALTAVANEGSTQTKTAGMQHTAQTGMNGKTDVSAGNSRGASTRSGTTVTGTTAEQLSNTDASSTGTKMSSKVASKDEQSHGSNMQTQASAAADKSSQMGAGTKAGLGGSGGKAGGGKAGAGDAGGGKSTGATTGIDTSAGMGQRNTLAVSAGATDGVSHAKTASNDISQDRGASNTQQRQLSSGIQRATSGGSETSQGSEAKNGVGGGKSASVGSGATVSDQTARTNGITRSEALGVGEEDLGSTEHISTGASYAQQQAIAADFAAKAAQQASAWTKQAEGQYGAMAGSGHGGPIALDTGFAGGGPNLSLMQTAPASIASGTKALAGAITKAEGGIQSSINEFGLGATKLTADTPTPTVQNGGVKMENSDMFGNSLLISGGNGVLNAALGTAAGGAMASRMGGSMMAGASTAGSALSSGATAAWGLAQTPVALASGAGAATVLGGFAGGYAIGNGFWNHTETGRGVANNLDSWLKQEGSVQNSLSLGVGRTIMNLNGYEPVRMK